MSIVKAFFGLGKTPRVMKFFEFQSFDDVNRMGGLITQIKNQVQKEGLKLTKAQQKFLDDQMEQVKLVFEKTQNKPDPNRLDTVIDKMNKGVPLNPRDQYDTSGGVLDAFQGFKPKVIQGGKGGKKQMSDPTKDDYVDPESFEGEELANIEFKEFANKIKGMSSTDRVAERLKDLKGVSLSELTGIEAQKIASELIGRKGPFKTISSKGAKEVLGELEKIIKKANTEKADGGRIGFFGGGGAGAGFAGDPMQGDKYVMSEKIPGSPQVPMGQIGPVNVGIFGGGGFSKNQIVPGVNVSTTDQNYGIMGQIPIGNTGLTLSADYMKSRANERFTGPRIPNQVFKNVPVDSDKFNVGINFTKRFKDGGRIGFKDGTPKNPGRRDFLKLMGGLASIPIIGKYFKPAAKVADKAAPVIQEGVKLGYDNFMLLVNKIKKLGKPADNLATKEREKVTRYVSDNNEYELIEDISSGDIRIVKDRIGGSTYGDEAFEVINDRSVLDYKSPKSFYNNQTKKSGKAAAEYDEVKEVANRDGTFDDFSEIDDFAVQEMLEEIGKAPIKKAGGGLAYMLGE